MKTLYLAFIFFFALPAQAQEQKIKEPVTAICEENMGLLKIYRIGTPIKWLIQSCIKNTCETISNPEGYTANQLQRRIDAIKPWGLWSDQRRELAVLYLKVATQRNENIVEDICLPVTVLKTLKSDLKRLDQNARVADFIGKKYGGNPEPQ